MIILFYVEYIVHQIILHCQWERRVIHTKVVYIYLTQVYVYGIAYFPFHSVPFRFPFRVLVTPMVKECHQGSDRQKHEKRRKKHIEVGDGLLNLYL